MLLATALLIIGLLLVVYSADRLVYAASILCRMLGIPPLIIGMTVVSIGTSLPEIMVSTTASLHGQIDLAVGTALGSNITNILLILGLAALLRPFTVHSDILRRELPLMLLVSVLAGLVLYDGQLSRLDGLFLLALALLWLLFTIKIARLAERQGSDSLTREQLAELPREGSLPVALLWLGVAMIVMPMATRMVVDNTTVLANFFAISELTVGLTVVAILSQGTQGEESSATVRQRVLAARERQMLRQNKLNAHLENREMKSCCHLRQEDALWLEQTLTQLGLSIRAWQRLLKVARTIADLAEAEEIERRHLQEALSYRAIDRMLNHLQKMMA